MLPAKVLNSYPYIFLEVDRVGDVPAVELESLLGIVSLARSADDAEHSCVKTAEGAVFVGRDVVAEGVGSAEIVLGSRAADGGELTVAVEVELDLTFAPPSVGFNAPVHICADIVTVALDPVKDNVIFHIRQWIYSSVLCVKIKAIFVGFLFFFIILFFHFFVFLFFVIPLFLSIPLFRWIILLLSVLIERRLRRIFGVIMMIVRNAMISSMMISPMTLVKWITILIIPSLILCTIVENGFSIVKRRAFPRKRIGSISCHIIVIHRIVCCVYIKT